MVVRGEPEDVVDLVCGVGIYVGHVNGERDSRPTTPRRCRARRERQQGLLSHWGRSLNGIVTFDNLIVNSEAVL